MNVISTELLVFFDVDDTLIMWDVKEGDEVVEIEDLCGTWEKVAINKSHIKLLKRSAAQGYHVVVWSHGGWEWAKRVIEALQLEEYVGTVMSKVITYVDDVPIEDWGYRRIYLNNGYGKSSNEEIK